MASKRTFTIHQAKRLVNRIQENKLKRSIEIVLLDIEKAFNYVWHQGLLFKMVSTIFYSTNKKLFKRQKFLSIPERWIFFDSTNTSRSFSRTSCHQLFSQYLSPILRYSKIMKKHNMQMIAGKSSNVIISQMKRAIYSAKITSINGK